MEHIKKSKAITGIIIGVIILVLIFGLVIGIIQAKSQNLASDTKTAPDKDQINTVGNTAANLMNGGLAATQGDKIYYINGNYFSEDRLMVMDWDGENEQELCALDGALSELNIIGDRLFFIERIYDGNPYVGATYISSSIYCLDRSDLSLTEVYRSTDYLSELFVIENQMYFSMDSEGKIFTADLDGSNATCVVEKDKPISDFSIYENKIFYFGSEFQMYSCDLYGRNESAISNVPSFAKYNIIGSKIYYSDDALAPSIIDTVECSVVYSADLDGNGMINRILKMKGGHFIEYFNIVDDVLYYYDHTAAYNDSRTQILDHSVIYAKKINGFSKKLGETDSWVSGLTICGNWLFYFDGNKNETVKIKL